MVDKNLQNSDPIQNGFSQINRKAPESLWSDIDQNLSLNNDEHAIGKAFNTLDRKAPATGWQVVKRQLIVDRVWLNIADRLNQRKRKFFWFYFSGFVGILILGAIAFNAFKFENQMNKNHGAKEFYSSKKNKQGVTNKAIGDKQLQNLSIENLIQIEPDESNGDKILFGRDEKNDVNSSVESQDENNLLTRENREFKKNKQQVEVKQKSEFFDSAADISISKLASPPISTLPIDQHDSHFTEPIEKNENVFNRFEAGLIAGLDNTWIFNNDVREGLNRFSLVDNKFSIGYSAGINFFFNFFKSHAVGLQVDLISKLNQQYSYFEDGNISTHRVSISQQKYSLYYKTNFATIFSENQSIIFKGGIFFSNAFKSELYSDNELFTEQVIGNYDFGLKAGIGSQHRFGDLIFEYGIQSDIGLINIATSPSYNSKKFNYTTSYLTGIYCSLRYSF